MDQSTVCIRKSKWNAGSTISSLSRSTRYHQQLAADSSSLRNAKNVKYWFSRSRNILIVRAEDCSRSRLSPFYRSNAKKAMNSISITNVSLGNGVRFARNWRDLMKRSREICFIDNSSRRIWRNSRRCSISPNRGSLWKGLMEMIAEIVNSSIMCCMLTSRWKTRSMTRLMKERVNNCICTLSVPRLISSTFIRQCCWEMGSFSSTCN